MPVVELSAQTHDLIKTLKLLGERIDSVTSEEWIQYLTQLDTQNHPHLFLMESLRAALLKDLRGSLRSALLKELGGPLIPPRPEDESSKSLFSRFVFWMLALSGTVLAVCEGFDAISSLLPIIPVPVWAGQALIGVFVALSVATFYAFDLSQISENLGVKIPESRKLLDVLMDQVQELKLIRKYLNIAMNHGAQEGLKNHSALPSMLEMQQNHLNQMQKIYEERLNNRFLKAAKLAAGMITGVLFFFGGYFVSQAPAIALLTALGLTAATMAWPLLVVSGVIGLAAFALYWYVQRPGVDHFIANVCGLDKEKIAALNPSKENPLTGEVVTSTTKLAVLRRNMESKTTKPVPHQDASTLTFFPSSRREFGTQTDFSISPEPALQMGL